MTFAGPQFQTEEESHYFLEDSRPRLFDGPKHECYQESEDNQRTQRNEADEELTEEVLDRDESLPISINTAESTSSTELAGLYWFGLGDISCAFALSLDNFANMAVFANILINSFGMPPTLVFDKMLPGTSLGVFFGDAVYFLMALHLARSLGRPDVTAIPLGIDAPSTVAIAYTVLGPAYMQALANGQTESEAGDTAWTIGTACMMCVGVFKLLMSFCGSAVQQWLPRASLLGALCGVAVAFLMLLPLFELFVEPIVGMLSLCILFYSLIALVPLPFRLPPVLISAFAGTVVYYILVAVGANTVPLRFSSLHLGLSLPLPSFGFLNSLQQVVRNYMPIVLPFALLAVLGGISISEACVAANEDFGTRNILLTEAGATLVAGLFGGVCQSVPYLGHSSYKRIGARAGYVLCTGVFLAVCGSTNLIRLFVEAIPVAALAPMLVFVAIDFLSSTFDVCPTRHYPAVAISIAPCLIQAVTVFLSTLDSRYLLAAENPTLVADTFNLSKDIVDKLAAVVALSNGALLTSVVWGCLLVYTIELQARPALICSLVASVLSLFGVMHSITATGETYLRFWELNSSIPIAFALAYLVYGLTTFALSFSQSFQLRLRNQTPA